MIYSLKMRILTFSDHVQNPSLDSDNFPFVRRQNWLGTCGAAKILSVGVELLKKWRQRDQGPDYVQYGPGGPVRYELDALMAFRALHRVRVSSKT
jgi:hypothetical protein